MRPDVILMPEEGFSYYTGVISDVFGYMWAFFLVWIFGMSLRILYVDESILKNDLV
jgi:hypothetical protein